MSDLTILAPRELSDDGWWDWVAGEAAAWRAQAGIEALSDLILLPSPHWLPPARRAFAAQGPDRVRWLPRLHTPQTWAAASVAPPQLSAAALSGMAGLDLLSARMRLQRHGPLAPLAADSGTTAEAAARLWAAAQWWREQLRCRHPESRATWLGAARQRLASGEGGASWDLTIQRLALEWAAVEPRFDTDPLWTEVNGPCQVVMPAGDDPFLDAWVDDRVVRQLPTRVLRAWPRRADPFDYLPQSHPQRRLAADAEEEAWAAASAAIDYLNRDHAPVALVAEDREGVRRIAALLARRGVAVADETGWTLSTTRAAAWVQAPIQAASNPDDRDAMLNWLKHAVPAQAQRTVDDLERHWRMAVAGQPRTMPPPAADLLAQARAGLAGLQRPGLGRLGDWCRALRAAVALGGPGPAPEPGSPEAAVAAALGLDPPWVQAEPDAPLDLPAFAQWVAATLENLRWVPPAPIKPQVVLTPLRDAALRGFGAVVLPGADQRRLPGSVPLLPALPGEGLRQELALAGRDDDARQRAAAFVALLRQPRLTIVRRHADVDETLQPSPWLLRWRALARRAGWAIEPERPVELVGGELPAIRVQPPLPAWAGPLPRELSVSTVGLLRECPYRFHARVRLGLQEQPELDRAAGPREQGDWLHLLLQRWHEARPEPRTVAEDVQALMALAQELPDVPDNAADDLYPLRAGLESFARRYVDWQHARERDGWHVRDCESRRRLTLPGPLELDIVGTLDRIDERALPDGTFERGLLDYKSGRIESWRDTVRAPLEDTQLGLYAALDQAQPARGRAARALHAHYVALGGPDEIESAEHPQVEETALVMLPALADELGRIRNGAAMPALGAEPTCGWCEYRGLCRRDDWSVSADGGAPEGEAA